uniref:Uncharacterized protein n=1 Tax=Prolemur simus TaxID=1328070 RepID=A0A8C9DPB9_PROSS
MGTLGQCRENTEMPRRLATAHSRQNRMMPGPRSLSLFTKKPPRNVPPPPAGTTRYPASTPPPQPCPCTADSPRGPPGP